MLRVCVGYVIVLRWVGGKWGWVGVDGGRWGWVGVGGGRWGWVGVGGGRWG